MTFALIIVVVFGINVAGGLDVVLSNANSLDGMPHILLRFMGILNSSVFKIVSFAWAGLGIYPHN